MFDIEKLDVDKHAEDGVDVHIINPANKSDTGVVIRVLGVFAPRFKELLRQARSKRELAKKATAPGDEAKDDVTEVAEMLADVTLTWSGVSEAGQEIPFSKSNAVRVYGKYSIIRGQVFDAALDVANFVRG